ncbi:MAG: hypothetical protein FJ095_18960, partial [Deltaproteobacteria bacterium]|nr:hypothetical protein [Deltaproteobacteria bacterium]
MKRPAARGLALAAAALAFDPLVPALLPKATLVLVVALAMAALDLDRLRTGPALVLAASLAAWLGLSLLWSGHPEPTVLAPWLVMALVGLAVSGGDAREHEADARAYARGVASVAGLLAIGQGLLGRPIEAGFGNPNALGLAVAPCLPLLLTPREETGVIALESSVFQRTRARLMVGAPFVLGLVAVVLGRSRSAWVGLALSTAWLMRGRSRWLSLLPVVALAAGLFAGREAVVGALGGRAWIARVDLRASLEALPLGV